MPVGHLWVFLGKLSVQIFCPFFNQIAWFSTFELYEFFIYFGISTDFLNVLIVMGSSSLFLLFMYAKPHFACAFLEWWNRFQLLTSTNKLGWWDLSMHAVDQEWVGIFWAIHPRADYKQTSHNQECQNSPGLHNPHVSPVQIFYILPAWKVKVLVAQWCLTLCDPVEYVAH